MKKSWALEYSYISRAVSETFIVAIISLVPLMAIAIVKCWWGNDPLGHSFAFSISRGELFFYSLSFVAGAYSTAIADDYPAFTKKFVGRKTIATISVILIGLSMIFIVLQRIKVDSGGESVTVDLNWGQIIPTSCIVFVLSLLMYGFSASVRNYQHLSSDTSTKLIRAKQVDFSINYKAHRGKI